MKRKILTLLVVMALLITGTFYGNEKITLVQAADSFVKGWWEEERDLDNEELYVNIDGVYYSKDKKTLRYYPSEKTEKSFIVPKWVRKIEMGAFFRVTNLESITIHKNVRGIYDDSIRFCTNLKEIIVDEENPKFTSYENCLYTKDLKRLYVIPRGLETLILSSKLEKVTDKEIFSEINNFKTIQLDGESAYFTVKDNVLYNKKMTSIRLFPSKKTSYKIPKTVKDVARIMDGYAIDWRGELSEPTSVCILFGSNQANSASDLKKISVEKRK